MDQKPGNLILTMISEFLPDDKKDKATELNDIFTQYFNQVIDLHKASIELENLIGTSEPIKKFADMVQQLNRKPTPKTQFAGFRKKARPWTQEEDHRLTAAIQVNGIENWPLVATIVGGGRTRSQCSQRWHRVLDPKINKCNWSREEEEKLLNAVKAYGNKAWTRIAAEMGNRSDVQCRFRYKFLLQKANDNPDEVQPISVPQAQQQLSANQNIQIPDSTIDVVTIQPVTDGQPEPITIPPTSFSIQESNLGNINNLTGNLAGLSNLNLNSNDVSNSININENENEGNNTSTAAASDLALEENQQQTNNLSQTDDIMQANTDEVQGGEDAK
ncbi:Myb-like DNA-binding domain containing protein [Tritrichomonas foetus]|uniref:Myb-like DNA-binding domain containing protein n=1 Tax=Tritrichomonas foetus TaxID=1144522 RepID=A0A1J4K403_9EUKA|nr:Myb-like DNA-binding domain containing protein [Tritrichomonas foetus]|eukprot:OHT05568.1 Myb-like DNA-binding domain containing protein [Tritrichomonas foetus]